MNEMNELEMDQVTGGISGSQENRDPNMNNGDVLSEIPGRITKEISENKGALDMIPEQTGTVWNLVEYVITKNNT